MPSLAAQLSPFHSLYNKNPSIIKTQNHKKRISKKNQTKLLSTKYTKFSCEKFLLNYSVVWSVVIHTFQRGKNSNFPPLKWLNSKLLSIFKFSWMFRLALTAVLLYFSNS